MLKTAAAKANKHMKQFCMFMFPDESDSDIRGVIAMAHSKNMKESGNDTKPLKYIKFLTYTKPSS